MPRGLIDMYVRFGGTFRLRLRSRRLFYHEDRRQVPLKRRHLSTRLHGITSQGPHFNFKLTIWRQSERNRVSI